VSRTKAGAVLLPGEFFFPVAGRLVIGAYWASAHSGTSYNERVCTVSAAEDVGELALNQVLSASASPAGFADLEVSVPSPHSGKIRMALGTSKHRMSDESDSNLNRCVCLSSP